MANLAPTLRSQNAGVVFSNNGLVLTVDNRTPRATLQLIDSDSDKVVDAARFVLERTTDVVYYALNVKAGPYLPYVDGDADIVISKPDFFIYWYVESALGKIGPLENHVLNKFILEIIGTRIVRGSLLRIYRYDFSTPGVNMPPSPLPILTEYEFPLEDYSSLYQAIIQVFQAIPVNDLYFYEIETPSGNKSLPRNFLVDFSPVVG